jgi:hypothetical protein
MKTPYRQPRIESARAFSYSGLKKIYKKPDMTALHFSRRRHLFPGSYARLERSDRNPLHEHGAE